MIKISIIGQSAFGESVAEEILKMNGTIISSIFSSSNPKDPLNQFGLENDLPVKNFKRLRDNEAIESFKSFDVDLLVMAYVTDIVPMEIIKSPRLGTIQYHPSLLPLHRDLLQSIGLSLTEIKKQESQFFGLMKVWIQVQYFYKKKSK